VNDSPSAWSGALHRLGPGIVAASAFACADVLIKLAFASGADTLSMITFRSFFGVAMMYVWLRIGTPAVPHAPRARWIAYGVGLLFAANVFALFKAIQYVEVPIAVVTYFAYPLLTGIGAALIGVETLGWRGLAAALAAFFGLALMIRAHPTELATVGLVFAVGAAFFRTAMLLTIRVALTGADPRLTTWYSIVSSTALFALISLVTLNWNGPQTALGWFAFVALGVTTTVAIFAVFVSTARVGSFQTALIMNLEPLLATVFSAIILDEVITPLQALGGAVMIAALCFFQLRR
jgi:drug/metabolite transporter (DMT)-like permease